MATTIADISKATVRKHFLAREEQHGSREHRGAWHLDIAERRVLRVAAISAVR